MYIHVRVWNLGKQKGETVWKLYMCMLNVWSLCPLLTCKSRRRSVASATFTSLCPPALCWGIGSILPRFPLRGLCLGARAGPESPPPPMPNSSLASCCLRSSSGEGWTILASTGLSCTWIHIHCSWILRHSERKKDKATQHNTTQLF